MSDPTGPGEAGPQVKPEEAPEIWKDVTAVFRATSAGMETGQMIHGAHFSLREAMSALELMDPKMDAGMNTSRIVTLQVAKEDNLLQSELSVPQILAVIDELVACEASWLSGDPVSNTLCTCLYLHDPSVLDSAVLAGYVRCLLKTCDIARTVILDANIYEEEDFQANKALGRNNFDFGESLDVDVVTHEINTIEQELELKVRKASGREVKGEVEPLQQDSSKELEYCEALLSRVKFRKAFYLINVNLHKSKAAMQGLRAAEKHLNNALRVLPKIHDTLDIAEPKAQDKSITFDTPGFDPSISRLVANAPPKDIKIQTRSASLKFMETFLSGVQSFFPLCDIDNLDEMVMYYRTLSSLNLTILGRSHALRLLHSEDSFMGAGTLIDLVGKSHHQFCGSCMPATKAEDFRIHASRAAKPIYMLFRLYCDNHTRQRRRLGKLLADWTILQHDSHVLDRQEIDRLVSEGVDFESPEAPYKFAFFGWVFEYTTQLLTDYFVLGLELGLYTDRELPVVYWYFEFILQVRLKNKSMAWRPPLAPVAVQDSSKTKGKKGKKAKQKKVKPVKPPPPSWEYFYTDAMESMCKALVMHVCALQRVGVNVPTISPDYMRNWYMNRFMVDMSRVPQPATLSLEQYQNWQGYMDGRPAAEIFRQVVDLYNVAKVLAGKAASHTRPPLPHVVASLKGFQRVAVMNSLAITTLSKKAPELKLSTEYEDKNIVYDFKHNSTFPAIGVK